jgi:hypothetical protein
MLCAKEFAGHCRFKEFLWWSVAMVENVVEDQRGNHICDGAAPKQVVTMTIEANLSATPADHWANFSV